MITTKFTCLTRAANGVLKLKSKDDEKQYETIRIYENIGKYVDKYIQNIIVMVVGKFV